jgi:hypothetical protein
MKKRGAGNTPLAWKAEEVEEQSGPLPEMREGESIDYGDLLLPGERQKSQPPTRSLYSRAGSASQEFFMQIIKYFHVSRARRIPGMPTTYSNPFDQQGEPH